MAFNTPVPAAPRNDGSYWQEGEGLGPTRLTVIVSVGVSEAKPNIIAELIEVDYDALKIRGGNTFQIFWTIIG